MSREIARRLGQSREDGRWLGENSLATLDGTRRTPGSEMSGSVPCTKAHGGYDRVSQLLMAAFFVYPMFNSLLHSYNLPWIVSMASGLLLACRNISRPFRLTLSTTVWLTIATWAASSFAILGAAATTSPKRLVCFIVTILLTVSLSNRNGWIRTTFSAVYMMCGVHAIATIVFLVDPTLYEGYIKPVFFANDASAVGYQSGLTSHYSYNGMILSAGTMMSFARAVVSFASGAQQRPVKWSTVRQWISVACFVLALLATSKRAPLIAVCCAIVIASLLAVGRNRFAVVSGLLVIAGLIISVVSVFHSYVPALDRLIQRFSDAATSSSFGDATSGRSFLWERAIELWRSKPLFGHGWGTYRYYWAIGYDEPTTSAHNVYLNLLAEVGVIGLCLFLLAAIQPAILLVRQLRGNPIGAPKFQPEVFFAASYQVFFFIYALSGSPLYDMEAYCFYFILSSGVGLSLRRRDSGRQENV